MRKIEEIEIPQIRQKMPSISITNENGISLRAKKQFQFYLNDLKINQSTLTYYA